MNTKKLFVATLFALITLAVIIRVVFIVYAFHYPQRTRDNDTPAYIDNAEYLLTKHEYPPTAFRTPGYPIFLAILFSVFGQNPFAITLIQFLLGGATIFLIYQIGIKLFHSKRSALLAGMLFALSLESIISAFFLLTETLFTFLVVCTICSLFRFQDGRRWGWLLLSGLITGLAILTRPIAILYPIISLFIIFFIGVSWRQRLIIHVS